MFLAFLEENLDFWNDETYVTELQLGRLMGVEACFVKRKCSAIGTAISSESLCSTGLRALLLTYQLRAQNQVSTLRFRKERDYLQ